MTASFEPGPLGDVERHRRRRWTLVFVRDLHHPPDDGLGGAHRPGPPGRVGAVRRRPRSRPPATPP